jgi:hypothetical protein
MPGAAWADVRLAFSINAAETAKAPLDMTAAAVEAVPRESARRTARAILVFSTTKRMTK